jgi:hypothetical protein
MVSLFLPAKRTKSPLSHDPVPLSYLELLDENLVYDVPLPSTPADKQPIHYLMPLPLTYLELPDENLVYDVPLLAGPADKQPTIS